MATKSKSRFRLSIAFLVSFCLIAGFVSVLVSYSIIRTVSENVVPSDEKMLVDTYSNVFDDNAYLFYYNMRRDADSSLSAEDIFFPDTSDYYRDQALTYTLTDWQNNFLYLMNNVAYYMSSSDEALYHETNLKSSQVIQAAQRFMAGGEAEATLDETYEAYFFLNYLADGSIEFTSGKGEISDRIFDTLQNLHRADKMLYYYADTHSTDTLTPPCNMTVFYGFTTLDIQELGLYRGDTASYFSGYGGDMLLLGVFFASILFALFLALYIGNGGLMTTVLVDRAPELSLVGFVLYGMLNQPLMTLSSRFDASDPLGILSVIAAWAASALLTVWSALLLMRVLKKELRRDFIRRSVLAKLFRLLKKLWSNLFQKIKAKVKRSTKVLLPVIFIFLALYACVNFREPMLLILYLVILLGLYLALNRALRKASRGYDAMLELTSQMANGNLDVSMDQDLGLFEPMKEMTLRIRDGLQKALEEERRSQNMRTELITNVSHDLRTPLTAIITYVDILNNPNLPEDERARCVNVLGMKSARLKTLIDDLFEVSKANSKNITLDLKELDFVKFILQYKLETEDRLDASGLDFRFELPDEKLAVRLDGQRAYRILENLTSNAIKYSAPNSRVYVRAERSGEYAKFTMKNVSAAELNFDPDEITERFVRGDLSRNTDGSGLGLTIVKSFVEIQGGIFHIYIDGDLFKAVILWPLLDQTGGSTNPPA